MAGGATATTVGVVPTPPSPCCFGEARSAGGGRTRRGDARPVVPWRGAGSQLGDAPWWRVGSSVSLVGDDDISDREFELDRRVCGW